MLQLLLASASELTSTTSIMAVGEDMGEDPASAVSTTVAAATAAAASIVMTAATVPLEGAASVLRSTLLLALVLPLLKVLPFVLTPLRPLAPLLLVLLLLLPLTVLLPEGSPGPTAWQYTACWCLLLLLQVPTPLMWLVLLRRPRSTERWGSCSAGNALHLVGCTTAASAPAANAAHGIVAALCCLRAEITAPLLYQASPCERDAWWVTTLLAAVGFDVGWVWDAEVRTPCEGCLLQGSITIQGQELVSASTTCSYLCSIKMLSLIVMH